MYDDLTRAIRDRRAILFVGAGVSMAVGLPSWNILAEHIAAELKISAAQLKSARAQLPVAEFYRLKAGSIGPLRSWMDRAGALIRRP